MRVRNGERNLHDFHQRYVCSIVADARAFRCFDLQPRSQLLECGHLVLRSLDDVLYPQLATANLGHLRLSARDHGYLDPSRIEVLDALAIADMEYLQGFAAGAKIEFPVRHGSINV